MKKCNKLMTRPISSISKSRVKMALPPPSQPYDWTFRRVVWATLVLISVLLGFWLLYRFNQVVFILFIAIVMGTVIRPVVTWLHQRGLPKIAGVILVYILLLTLLISFVLLLFPLIVEQGTTIGAAVPGYYQNLREWMVNYPNQLIVRLSEFLPATLPSLQPRTTQQTGQEVMASAGQALGYLTLATRVIFTAMVILVLAFYWTLEGPRIIQSFLLLVPHDQRESISELISAMETKVGSYIAGQGVPLPGHRHYGAACLSAHRPAQCPGVGAHSGRAGSCTDDWSAAWRHSRGAGCAVHCAGKLVWVIVATVVIQQLENSLLVPRIMRKAVGVNPFVTLLALFAFSSLFGIAGALMAIPMAAIIQLLLNRFVFHPSTMEPEVSAGRDYASRLRYEAQDLAQDSAQAGAAQERRLGPEGQAD
jgi:predicted PurR-regulated permease PerM